MSTKPLIKKTNAAKPSAPKAATAKKPAAKAAAAAPKKEAFKPKEVLPTAFVDISELEEGDPIVQFEDGSEAPFDRSRIVVTDLRKDEFNINGMDIETKKSEYTYLSDEGISHQLLLMPKKQSSFPPAFNYPINLAAEAKIPENAEGIQIQYQATSLNTIDEPVYAEQYFIDLMSYFETLIEQKIIDTLDAEKAAGVKKSDCIFGNVAATFRDAANDGDFSSTIKPCLSVPVPKADADPKKKVFPRPLSFYAKVATAGKKEKLRATAKFYVGGKEVNPIDLIDGSRGLLTPLFAFGVFYGPHGKTSFGASVKPLVVQASWEDQPISTTSNVPKKQWVKSVPIAEDDSPAPPAKKVIPSKGKASKSSDDDQDAFASDGEADASPAPQSETKKLKTAVLKKKPGAKPSAKPAAGKAAAPKPGVGKKPVKRAQQTEVVDEAVEAEPDETTE